MKTETEFNFENYQCPFRKQKCIKDGCTHFTRSDCEHYYWGNEITIYDDGRCYAGNSGHELWKARYIIKPAYKNLKYMECYKKLRNKGRSQFASIILALDYDEKIPYDFDEMRKIIKANKFDPLILPIKNDE